MPRIAWFSPMPPVRSGVAAYSAEVVAALRAEHLIDVYVDGPRTAPQELEAPRSAHDFISEHHKRPYELTVYQLGNSSHHDYTWPYVFRYPGLTVLHDAHLHHARAAALLRTKRAAHYRAEFVANHPGASAGLAELAVAGFDTHLLYEWPMTKLVVDASRVTAVHAAPMVPALCEQSPGAAIERIRIGHGDLVTAAQRAIARERVRRLRAIPDDAPIFGIFGGLTPDKRVPQILDAFAAVRPVAPAARLLLAGAPASHYDVVADVDGRNMQDAVIITGYIDDEHELTEHLAACDVSMNLRWPTAREVSGPWLRALAAGVPTVTIDLAHLAEVPSLDPRTWALSHCAARQEDAPEAVTVAIDILDEAHSLRSAMRRLATDADLRTRLGAAGQRHWAREHSLSAMIGDYRRVIARALETNARVMTAADASAAGWPAHLLDSAESRLQALLAPFELPPERSAL